MDVGDQLYASVATDVTEPTVCFGTL